MYYISGRDRAGLGDRVFKGAFSANTNTIADMATYSESDFDIKHYDDARPNYPDLFYETLMQYHSQGSGSTDLAVDIGCGSGFVAFKLTEYFDKVIGTDISQVMVDQCAKSPLAANTNIEFICAPAEKAPQLVADGLVNLLTGAECCHWVDHSRFFAESARILQPGGTLAYWFYGDPVFVDHPEANKIYMDYTYGSSKAIDPSEPFERYMGPFYEQPGHEYLRLLLSNIQVPSDTFKDVVRNEYRPDRDGENNGLTTLKIEKLWTLEMFGNYVKSWSAYHAWMKVHGEKYDIAEAFVQDLKTKNGWTDSTELRLVFPTVYTFARRR